jgi:hypothetical protein
MTPEQIASALDAADVIEAWLGAVRAHAELVANQGQEIPGFKLVDKSATRKWRDEALAAGELSLVFGLDESSIYSKKLLSPAQAESALRSSCQNPIEPHSPTFTTRFRAGRSSPASPTRGPLAGQQFKRTSTMASPHLRLNGSRRS